MASDDSVPTLDFPAAPMGAMPLNPVAPDPSKPLVRRTRDLIREFSRAFGRPVHAKPVFLTITERELLGKLIMEECAEYCIKGLGLRIGMQINESGRPAWIDQPAKLRLELNEGHLYDPIESADGLADMNVVIHFNANWHGFDLDAVTAEVHESNMSKLDGDGKPIINECQDEGCPHHGTMHECDARQDLTKPAGKILKGPGFRKPNIAAVIGIKICGCGAPIFYGREED